MLDHTLAVLPFLLSARARSHPRQAEEKRKLDYERQEAAAIALRAQIGTWEKGQINKTLMDTDVALLQVTKVGTTALPAARRCCSLPLIAAHRTLDPTSFRRRSTTRRPRAFRRR